MKTTMIKEVYGEGVLALADLRRWRSALAVCITLPGMHWTNEFELHWRWWDGRGAWATPVFLAMMPQGDLPPQVGPVEPPSENF